MRRQETELFTPAEAAVLSRLSLKAVNNAIDRKTVPARRSGRGRLLAPILRKTPQARGILFDAESVVAGAPPVLDAAGVADRIAVVGGSFFDSVPSGGDAYVLKHIVHDWEESKVLEILRNVRNAMAPKSKLVLIETKKPRCSSYMAATKPWSCFSTSPLRTKWFPSTIPPKMFAGGRIPSCITADGSPPAQSSASPRHRTSRRHAGQGPAGREHHGLSKRPRRRRRAIGVVGVPRRNRADRTCPGRRQRRSAYSSGNAHGFVSSCDPRSRVRYGGSRGG